MSRLHKFFSLVFFSAFLLTTSIAIAQTVNVNTGTKTELQTITGIGEKTAQRIIEERKRGGSFESVEDFTLRIKGLGQKRAAKLLEAGLFIGNEQASHEFKPHSQGATVMPSVVAKEVAAVKKRFKSSGVSLGSEPYLIKAN